MLLCLTKQCLFWEDARALMALLEAKTKAAITAFDSDTAVPPLVQFADTKVRVMKFAAFVQGWVISRVTQRSAGAEQSSQALCALPSTTASELEASFAYVQITALHELNQVREQNIPIPLAESIHVVRYLGQGGKWLIGVSWEPNN